MYSTSDKSVRSVHSTGLGDARSRRPPLADTGGPLRRGTENGVGVTVTASPRVVTSQRCDAVLDVLERLDRVLEHAVARAEAVYGVSPGQDPHRGLYVSAPDARRLLLRDPVTPLFALPAAGMGSPLGELKARFGLSTFELNVVVLALAPELDLRYDGCTPTYRMTTRRRPTVGLALDLLCRAPSEKLAARAHFASDAPLLAHRLLRLTHEPLQPEPVLLAHALVLDQQVVRMLIGVAGGDPRLADVAHRYRRMAGLPVNRSARLRRSR